MRRCRRNSDARRRHRGCYRPAAMEPRTAGPRPGATAALRLGVVGAVLAFVALATVWLWQPTYRPTDEASHVAYARELSHGRLPTIDSPMSGAGDPRLARVLRSRDAVHRTIWTANHPPLYYALAAVPLRVAEATAHPVRGVLAARLLSIGLSALGLVAMAYVVLQLVPGRPQLVVAATGLAALLPAFINVSAVVYNDSLAFLTSTGALAAAVVFVVRGPSATRLAAVAVAAALAALTRASGLLVAAVAALAVLVAVWRAGHGGAARRLARAALWTGVLAAAVAAAAGWFYLRNRALYGDLTGSAALLERFGRTPRGCVLELLAEPGFWRSQQQRLWGVTTNLPGSGGRLSRQLWLLGLVPLAGLMIAGGGWLRRLAGGARPDPGRAVAVALCVLLLALLELTLAQFVSRGGGAHVRYLFPGMVAIGLAAAVGLAALPGGRRGLPALAMLVVMSVANLWVRWRYLGVLGAPGPPQLLAAVVPLLLAGLGLQATALWRLAPAGGPRVRRQPASTAAVTPEVPGGPLPPR